MSLLTVLMPKTDEFFSDFEAQADAVVEGTRLLKELLENFTDLPRKCAAIKAVEHRADDITHRAFARLHTQFITPFDRAEMHRLLSRIDDVLDLADGAAARLELHDIERPIPEASEAASILLAQAELVAVAVRGLRRLQSTVPAVLDACRQIKALEKKADTLTRMTMAKLFRRGSDPLLVMKWKEIIDLLQSATNRAEDVADVLEGVVLEHT